MPELRLKPICAIANCAEPVSAKGLCRRHYRLHWDRSRTKICTSVGCDRVVASRGLCEAHYRSARKSGAIARLAPRRCLIEGCEKRHFGHGWCVAHYKRWLRHGHPLRGGTALGVPLRYLHEHVLCHKGDSCLTWPYARNPVSGQAIIAVRGKRRIASRVVLELTCGLPPAPHYEAAHTCGKGHEGCVNPSHLAWKTHVENLADKLVHGTHNRGERNHMTKLTEADVHSIRELFVLGVGECKIAKRFGVSDGAINAIRRGRSWAWLP